MIRIDTQNNHPPPDSIAVSSPLGKGTAKMYRQNDIPRPRWGMIVWFKVNYSTIMPLNILPEFIPNLRAEKNSLCCSHVQIPAT